MSGNQLPLRTSSEAVRDAIREIIRAAHKDHGHYSEQARDPNPIEVPGFDFTLTGVEADPGGLYRLLGNSIYGKVFARTDSSLVLDGEQLSGSGWAFVLTPGGINYYSWQLWFCNAIESNSPSVLLTELSGGPAVDRPTPMLADFGEDTSFTANDGLLAVVAHKGPGSLFKNTLTGDISFWNGFLWEPLTDELTWSAISGKPATFPAAAHNHPALVSAEGATCYVSGSVTITDGPGSPADGVYDFELLTLAQVDTDSYSDGDNSCYLDTNDGNWYIQMLVGGEPLLLVSTTSGALNPADVHFTTSTSYADPAITAEVVNSPVASSTFVGQLAVTPSSAFVSDAQLQWKEIARLFPVAKQLASSVGRTLTPINSNVIIRMTNVTPVQIWLRPSVTAPGFHCTVVRLGAEVTFMTDTGTIKSVDNYVKIDKVNGAVGVLQLDDTNFLLSGQLGV